MGFGDLKTPGGLKVLNDFLADKSYIEGLVGIFTHFCCMYRPRQPTDDGVPVGKWAM